MYSEKFPKGSKVFIAQRAVLEHFQQSWKLHNPLADEQFAFAGAHTSVTSVGFYHGGDALYELEGVPGVWHEQCLTRG